MGLIFYTKLSYLLLTLGCATISALVTDPTAGDMSITAFISGPLSRRIVKHGIQCAGRGRAVRMASGQGSGGKLTDVIFVRHGQSTWNKANRFIGWTDTELTDEGVEEAREAGRIVRSYGISFDEVHTSMLKRTIKTAWVILDEINQEHLQLKSHWRLNERSYGALVGMDKKECVRKHGKDQVKKWRRSYDFPPPPQDKGSMYYPGHDSRYKGLTEDQIPLSESLHDTRMRVVKYWEDVLQPAIKSGKRILVVGHENNLRALFMHIDGISKEEIVNLEIPRAIPMHYRFDEAMKPVKMPNAASLLSGCYLANQDFLAAIKERDLKNVYDLNIEVNLEEMQLDEAVDCMKQGKTKRLKNAVMSLFRGRRSGESTTSVEVSDRKVDRRPSFKDIPLVRELTCWNRADPEKTIMSH